MNNTPPLKHGPLPPAPYKHRTTLDTKMTATEKAVSDNWGKLSPKRIGMFLWMSEKQILVIARRLGLPGSGIMTTPVIAMGEASEPLVKELRNNRRSLPDEQKKRIATLAKEGLSNKKIAKAINVSEGTIHGFMRRHPEVRALKPREIAAKPRLLKPAGSGKAVSREEALAQRRANIIKLIENGIIDIAVIAEATNTTANALHVFLYNNHDIRDIRNAAKVAAKAKARILLETQKQPQQPAPLKAAALKPKKVSELKTPPQKLSVNFYERKVSDKPKSNGPISEEEIQQFLANKSITICPPAGSEEILALPPLVWDQKTRKRTRRKDIDTSGKNRAWGFR